MEVPLDDETLQRVYAWVDEIPLSRPKRSIARDFSDAILAAEVVAFYFPKLVQMHNYSAANSATQKHYNWNTLNRKVLKRLHLYLSKDEIDDLVACRTGAVEQFLVRLQLKIANFREKRRPSSASSPSPGSTASPVMRQGPMSGNNYYDDMSSAVSTNSAAAGSGCSGLNGARMSSSESANSPERLDFRVEQPSTGGGGYAKEPQSSVDKDVRSPSMYQVHPLESPLVGKGAAYDGGVNVDGGRSQMVGDSSASELLQEKDTIISELRETIQILEIKVQKLEQLVRLKDGKIQTLSAKLRSQKPQS